MRSDHHRLAAPFHQSVLFQPLQRLPHRCPGGPVPLGELGLRERLVRRKDARENILAKPLVDGNGHFFLFSVAGGGCWVA